MSAICLPNGYVKYLRTRKDKEQIVKWLIRKTQLLKQ